MRARVKAGNEVCGGPAGRDMETTFALLDRADQPLVGWRHFDASCRVTAPFSEDHGVHTRPSQSNMMPGAPAVRDGLSQAHRKSIRSQG